MASTSLSARQIELLKAVIEVTKSDVDWNAVAENAEYKTSKYARDTWTSVKAKLVKHQGSAISLSTRQFDLVKVYIELMQGTTDWTAVAKNANFKTSKYARDSWSQVKTKLVGLQASTANDNTGGTTKATEFNDSPAPKTKKSTAIRKRKTNFDEAEEPVKKSKKSRTTSATTVKAEADDNAEAAVEEDATTTENVERGKTFNPGSVDDPAAEEATGNAEKGKDGVKSGSRQRRTRAQK